MKQIAFLLSATGGGHWAAARAISAALELRYPHAFSFDYIDVFREYTPPPWRYAPEIYLRWVRYSPRSYGVIFWWGGDVLMRGPLRGNAPFHFARERFKRLLDDHHPDSIVVLHGAFTRFVVAQRDALEVSIPIVTVITDLARPHLGWYHPEVDRCLVPCEPALQRGIQANVPKDKLQIVGHPAHPKFSLYKANKRAAQRTLGWKGDLPTVLLLGGGEGIGRIAQIAAAIDRAQLGAHLVVICGRNARLKERLESHRWSGPIDVYGFVDNMEVFMRAADVLVTKAGPGTIAESAISGIPMILFGAIPLQETPNAHYVVENGAGVYVKNTGGIVATLRRWLRNEEIRALFAAGARSIGHPDASFKIASEIAGLFPALSPLDRMDVLARTVE